MDEGALSSYVSQARAAVDAAPEMSARTAELRLTQPLLDALGWDLQGADVVAGVEVDGERLDFGLGVDDVAILVDTVAPSEGIAEADVRRIATGMRHLSVRRGILLDGHTVLFLTDAGERFAHDRYALADLADAREAVEPFTRAATAERAEPDPAAVQRAATELQAERDALVDEVATRLTAATDVADPAVADAIHDASERFLDELIGAFEARGVPAEEGSSGAESAAGEEDRSGDDATAETESPTDDDATPERKTQEPDDDSPGPETATDDDPVAAGVLQATESAPAPDDDADAEDSETSSATGSVDADPVATPNIRDRTPAPDAEDAGEDEEYVVRFFDGSTTVGAVGGDTPQGALRQGVEYLEDAHALVSRLSLPWRPEDVGGIAVLNDRPEHPDGTAWSDYVELSTGDYLLTGVETTGCREIIESLAGGAGLRVMFQGDW